MYKSEGLEASVERWLRLDLVFSNIVLVLHLQRAQKLLQSIALFANAH
jgi:hypothetical protein